MINKIKGKRHVIDQTSDLYPKALLDLEIPPDKLYVIGNPRVLGQGIGIVGARRTTDEACSKAAWCAGRAAEHGHVVVSGGARGIDTAAHRGALDAGGKTIAVLASGLDNPYPEENVPLYQEIVAAGGALVSEYPWGYRPSRYAFLARNRITAALSNVLFVPTCAMPSGTFKTAELAMDLSREVWALVPEADACQQGCSQLVQEYGARPLRALSDFKQALEELSAQAE